MFDALRPGGRFVAQCGGEGNVSRFHANARAVAAERPYAEHLDGWPGPWNFASPELTARAARGGRLRGHRDLARAVARPARRAARLHRDRLPRAVPAAAAGGAAPPVRRGRRRPLRRRDGARLRAAQHRRAPSGVDGYGLAPCRPSSRCPETGSGRRSWPPRSRSSTPSEASTTTSGRSEARRSTPTASPSRTRCSTPARARTPCCSPRSAGRSGTPPWPRTRRRRAPSRGCSACARGSACSRTCARSGRARRCSTRARSSGTGSRAPTCWSCAS